MPTLYRQPGMLIFWSHEPVAPWQTAEWLEQMRQQLRANAFLRMIRNTFVTSESTFVDPAWWAACEDATMHPVVADPSLAVSVGVDASVKRDSTAIVAVTWDEAAKKIRLVWHRIFQASPTDPLDFEATVEETVLGLKARFNVREVRFDPYQMQAVSQRLVKAGVPMVEFPQSVPNLTEASTNLYELIKGANLAVYVDEGIRLAVHRAVALETARGWRIAKEKQSHKIDVVIALGTAALGALKQPREDGLCTF
jgi:phage terminase large subunit-like protein